MLGGRFDPLSFPLSRVEVLLDRSICDLEELRPVRLNGLPILVEVVDSRMSFPHLDKQQIQDGGTADMLYDVVKLSE